MTNKKWVLALETSCDETSCGIVSTDFEVKANVIFKQETIHAQYGGVIPEVASRAHLEKVSWVYFEALKEAQLELGDLELLSYTRGPGLIGALLVGASFCTGLAHSSHKPLLGINHLEGHISAGFIQNPQLRPPFLALIVSGGHTELIQVSDYFQYQLLGRTRDDAAGEAFDKCGKILGLGYPSGPKISEEGKMGNRDFVELPLGLQQKSSLEFSFSGLKTAFSKIIQDHTPEWVQENRSHLAASLEEAIVKALVRKCESALHQTKLPHLVVCGGVSANQYLRECLGKLCIRKGIGFTVPHPNFCTDNGAMIAAAAALRLREGQIEGEFRVTPNLKLAF